MRCRRPVCLWIRSRSAPFPEILQVVSSLFTRWIVMGRILLSIPHMGTHETRFVQEAFESNWLSTVGPNVVAFEKELEERIGVPAAAVSSGTAAIHLGLRALGVGPGDDVFCQSLTFIATANPIVYLGGNPVFLDSERATWNFDPQLLVDALRLAP